MKGAKSVDADPGVGVAATVDLVEGVRPPTPSNGVRSIGLSGRCLTGIVRPVAVLERVNAVASFRDHGSGEYAKLALIGQRFRNTSGVFSSMGALENGRQPITRRRRSR